jgi:hypothetical protein
MLDGGLPPQVFFLTSMASKSKIIRELNSAVCSAQS